MKNDHIFYKRGFIPKKECECLINYFESNEDLHIPGQLGFFKTIDPARKKSTDIVLNILKNFFWIKTYLQECIEEYEKQYPFLKRISQWNICEDYRLQRYYPGEGYFVEHCENQGPDLGGNGGDRRMLAWMIYLNDVTDGGHTVFPQQKRKFQPRMGDVLIWPAYFTHSHHGMTSKKHTKYIATGWYEFIK